MPRGLPTSRPIVRGRDIESSPGESIRWDVKLLPGTTLHPESGQAEGDGLPVGHWEVEFAGTGRRKRMKSARTGQFQHPSGTWKHTDPWPVQRM